MSVTLLLLVIGLTIGITIENRLDISQLLIQTKMGMDSEGMDNSSATYSGSKDKNILYWVAPMDPNYRRNEPGKSPMGMDLKPVYESENESGKNGSPIVKISPEVVNNLGVRTITVVRGPLSKEINTVGYLSYNEKKINHIHTRTEGWIENLTVRAEGERVKKGQPLFEIYSPLLVVAQEEYL
ncbi:MAG: efflux RND transporter periplasmic adaptor subunit, partial [Candidatus Neomarinimicrobiota bacterium]